MELVTLTINELENLSREQIIELGLTLENDSVDAQIVNHADWNETGTEITFHAI